MLRSLVFVWLAACNPVQANVFHPETSGGAVVLSGTSGWILDDSYCTDRSRGFCWDEDFQIFNTNCSTINAALLGTATGTGATCAGTTLDGHPGVWSCATGTTATGGCRYTTNSTIISFGANDGQYCTGQLVQFPTLSTAVIQYLFRIGFQSSVTQANSANAIQAVYDFATNGNFWALQTCKGSACLMTKCDGNGGTTSAPVAANTWYSLIECMSSDGTDADLYVNGTKCVSLTTAANLPTGTGNATGWGAQMANNTGSTPASELVYVDYYSVRHPFLAAR